MRVKKNRQPLPGGGWRLGSQSVSRDYFSLQQSLPQVLPASLQQVAQDLPLSAQHFLQASPAKRLVERAARARTVRIVFMMDMFLKCLWNS